jgi:hypothetical protein
MEKEKMESPGKQMQDKHQEPGMHHPRRDLPFTCNRRGFWRALFNEALVLTDSLKGTPPFNLSELGSLPDEQLAQIKPIISPDYRIFVEQRHVCARGKKTGVVLKLFPIQKQNLVVFNLFDGKHTMGQIGERVSEEMDWDEVQGFAHARNIFLSLVRRFVCAPKDPLEFNE